MAIWLFENHGLMLIKPTRFQKRQKHNGNVKALEQFTEKISTKIQPKNTYYAAFLDVEKAFDKQPVYKDCSTN